jgi:hypothetical protein
LQVEAEAPSPNVQLAVAQAGVDVPVNVMQSGPQITESFELMPTTGSGYTVIVTLSESVGVPQLSDTITV